jgi:hypothetical protein
MVENPFLISKVSKIYIFPINPIGLAILFILFFPANIVNTSFINSKNWSLHTFYFFDII